MCWMCCAASSWNSDKNLSPPNLGWRKYVVCAQIYGSTPAVSQFTHSLEPFLRSITVKFKSLSLAMMAGLLFIGLTATPSAFAQEGELQVVDEVDRKSVV